MSEGSREPDRHEALAGVISNPQGSAAGPVRPPVLDSSELLRGHRAVEIHHNGELYRLQATRSGKLILTK